MNRKTYVLATDGSDQAREAEKYIEENMDPDDVSVMVVSVTEKLPPGMKNEGQSLTVDPETIRNELTEQIRDNAEAAQTRLSDAGFDVDISLLAGDPGQEICEYVRKTDAYGVVMARRGHGEVTELLIGSVSQYVIHHASVPVVVVPGPDEE